MNLKDHIWLIWETLERSHINFESTKYLNSPHTEDEFNFVRGSLYFKNIAGSLWRICVIDLHKVISISRNDSFSLKKLINKLKDGHYHGHNIPMSAIIQWELAIEENDVTIKKLLTLRNKLFAHTDVEFVDERDVTFSEVSEIYAMIETIISDVYFCAFDSHADLTHRFSKENGQNEIKILSDYKLQYRNKRMAQFGLGSKAHKEEP